MPAMTSIVGIQSHHTLKSVSVKRFVAKIEEVFRSHGSKTIHGARTIQNKCILQRNVGGQLVDSYSKWKLPSLLPIW